MKKIKADATEHQTGIWYHPAPSNLGGPSVERIVELQQDKAPDSGLNYRTNTNYENNYWDDGRTSKTDVDGMLKLDKSNAIWRYDDSAIRQAVIEKVKEHYDFINESNLSITINRQAGTITYKGKEVKAFVLKADEDVRVKMPFNLLEVGDNFYIDKDSMKAEYIDIDNNQQWRNIKWESNKTLWVKESDYKFCTTDTKKCITARYALTNVKVGAVFTIDADAIKSNNTVMWNYYKKKLGRELTDEDRFIKKTNNTFVLYPEEKNQKVDKNGVPVLDDNGKPIMTQVVFKVTNPNSVPIFFNIFVVQMAEKDVPKIAISFNEVTMGGVFVIPDAYIPKRFTQKYKPYITTFMKINATQFILYKAGQKYGKDDDGYITVADKEVKDKDKFTLTGIELQYTDWDSRKISSDIRVIVYDQGDIAQTKKQATLDTALEKLFSKYEVKQDNKGKYIKIPEKALLSELGSIYQEFAGKTAEKQIDMPEYEKDASGKPILDDKGQVKPQIDPTTDKPIVKKQTTEMGNTERFSWVFDVDSGDNKERSVIITDHQGKK